MKTLKYWVVSMVIAFAMSCTYMLDGHAFVPDFDLVKPRPTDSMAYRLCASIGGPNAWFFYTESGKLVCVNKRGNKLTIQP